MMKDKLCEKVIVCLKFPFVNFLSFLFLQENTWNFYKEHPLKKLKAEKGSKRLLETNHAEERFKI